MMIRLMMALALLWAVPALAADLRTEWEPVTTDDTGAPLTVPVEKYAVFECGAEAPLIVVSGDVFSHVEEDVITGTGTFCREVAANVSPFWGARSQATLVVVVPGSPANLSIQALQ